MDSTTSDITQICVPPPDEALPKAFADLDASLAAWKAAFLEAQGQLLKQAETQGALQGTLEAQARDHAQLQASLEAQAKAQADMQQELKAQVDAQARAEEAPHARHQAAVQHQGQAEESHSTADRQPAQPDSPVPAAAADGPETSSERAPSVPLNWDNETISKHVRVYGDIAKPAAEMEPRPASAEENEDEALLSALDPETAKAIRVMRRMSANQKSVRELLEQYQAAQANAKTEPGKKSWFRRGK